MSEVLRIMDDQMLKWVAELDELHREKREIERAIHELEQNVDAARRTVESMKTSYDEEHDIEFADPGGRSALRAASPTNPRSQPCPNCGRENVLTPKDVQLGYQCNQCADAAEGIGSYSEGL